MLKIITEEQANEIEQYLTNDVFSHIRDNILKREIPKMKRYEAFKDLETIFIEQAAIFEKKAVNQTRLLSDIKKDMEAG